MRIRQTPIPIRKLHQLRHPQKQVRSMQLITGILPRRMPCQIPHHQVLPSLPIQITIHQSPISHRQLFIMPKSQLTKPQQMPFRTLNNSTVGQPRNSPNSPFKSFIRFFISTITGGIFIPAPQKAESNIYIWIIKAYIKTEPASLPPRREKEDRYKIFILYRFYSLFYHLHIHHRTFVVLISCKHFHGSSSFFFGVIPISISAICTPMIDTMGVEDIEEEISVSTQLIFPY